MYILTDIAIRFFKRRKTDLRQIIYGKDAESCCIKAMEHLAKLTQCVETDPTYQLCKDDFLIQASIAWFRLVISLTNLQILGGISKTIDNIRGSLARMQPPFCKSFVTWKLDQCPWFPQIRLALDPQENDG